MAASWATQRPTVVTEHLSTYDGSVKFVLAMHDGKQVEAVLMPEKQRLTLCVSSQVGCAQGCVFCHTGRMGLTRNLSAGEIVSQIVHADAWVRAHPDWVATQRLKPNQRVTNVVFMGMGEPLDNLPGLLPALAVLTDRHGLAYAQERLTVCTVGHVPGIHALRELGWKRLGLALSLNSVDPTTRETLMPHSVRYSLAEIQRSLCDYRQRANLALGVHWCLLPGINDSAAEVRALATFLAPLGRCLVHVIPYNPGTVPLTRPPTEAEIVTFVARLRAAGIAVRRRITKGRSVMAACGQLGAGRNPVTSA
jgi:23S rRNA (adenine2503-C2)-methyltransferase